MLRTTALTVTIILAKHVWILECAKLHILTTRNVDILVLNVLLAKKNAPRMGTIFLARQEGYFLKHCLAAQALIHL